MLEGGFPNSSDWHFWVFKEGCNPSPNSTYSQSRLIAL